MGGIVGKLDFDPCGRVPDTLVARMNATLTHRGRDFANLVIDGPVALAWCAFAPQRGEGANERQTIRVIADAELQNAAELRRLLQRSGHSFETPDDAEVIAHAYEQWGERCVERLHGPFAFALWDQTAHRLLLARDHVGMRPLHFAMLHGDGIVFASEIKAILEDPSVAREWSPQAIDAYLALGYVPAPYTIYRRVSKLEPAHLLVVEGRALRVRQYWDFPFERGRKLSEADTLRMIDGALGRAMHAQMASDAVVGALNSGGIASATLLSVLPRVSGGATTVSVGLEGDTSDFVRVAATARHFGCAAELDVAVPDLAEAAPILTWHLDEPHADPAVFAQYAVCAAARRHVEVALTGHGAAALWAGYARHRVERVESNLRGLLGSPLAALSGHLAHALPEYVKGARALSHLALPPAAACATKHAYGFFENQSRRRLYTRTFASEVRYSNPFAQHLDLYRRCPSSDPLTRALYVDARTSMADGTLTVAERVSLAAGLQLRFPYLDRDLVQLASIVPSSLKQHGRSGMYALRRLLGRRLPLELMPPPAPAPALRPWLRDAVASLVPTVLLDERFDNRGIFSRPALAHLWEEHCSGHDDHAQRFWSLLMLEFWFREFIDGDAAARPVEYAVLRAA